MSNSSSCPWNGRFASVLNSGRAVQGGDVDLLPDVSTCCSWNSRFCLLSGASISCQMER